MARYEELMEKTSNLLVELHNQLNPSQALEYWKKPKAELVEMIIELENRPSSRTIREASLAMLCEVVYYEDKSKPASPDNRVPANHPKARSVGHEYLAIIDMLKQEFPDAQTSVACLRWYAVKVRAEEFGYEGYRLAQRRPRAKPTKIS